MMDGLTTYLFTQGVLGVVCLVLGTVCVKLNSKNERLQTKIDGLQESRLQDSRDISKELTVILQANSQSNELLSAKIEAVKSDRQHS